MKEDQYDLPSPPGGNKLWAILIFLGTQFIGYPLAFMIAHVLDWNK